MELSAEKTVYEGSLKLPAQQITALSMFVSQHYRKYSAVLNPRFVLRNPQGGPRSLLGGTTERNKGKDVNASTLVGARERRRRIFQLR